MVNPGAFRGSRKDFLMSQKVVYAEALTGGYVADALADIQRKYFKRYPIDLPHNEEPSQEHLSNVDDNAPDVDPEEPNRELLCEEEFARKMEELQQRAELIRYRKAQIKRWMAYQHMKDQDSDPMEPSPSNPFNNLIFYLSGKEPGRPRKKTAVNVWRKSQRHNIEVRVKNLAKTQGIPNDRLAALRDKVARDMFNALPRDQQDKWKKQAEDETTAATEEWERLRKSGPSTKPEDRQLCIQSVVRVAQPIVDLLSQSTGWNWSLIGGGPEPAHGGQLNIMSIHAGVTPGEVKMNFGRAERSDYKKYFVPIFGRFLKKCFTPEECRARALVESEGLVALSAEELENSGANLDSIEDLELQDGQNSLSSAISGSPTSSPTSSCAATSSAPAPNPTLPDFLNKDSSPNHSPPLPPSFPPDASNSPSLSTPSPPGTLPSSSSGNDSASSSFSAAPNFPSNESLNIFAPSAPCEVKVTTPETQATDQFHETTSDEERQEQPYPRHSTPFSTLPSIPFQVTPPRARMATPPLSPRATPPRRNIRAPESEVDDVIAGASATAHDAGLQPLPASPTRTRCSTSSQSRDKSSEVPGPPPDVYRSTAPSSYPTPPADPDPMSVDLDSTSTDPSSTSTDAHSGPNPDSVRSTRSSIKRRSAETSSDSQPPSKRGRISGASIPDQSRNLISPADAITPPSITPPTNAPKWFENTLLMLQDGNLGSEWSSLLDAWVKFEVEAEFKENGKLGTHERPVCIGEWIQRRRSTTWRPTFNVAEVETKFQKWWTSLQPSWRISDGEIQHSLTDGDWDCLRKPGLNGLFSVLVALFYWGLAVEKAGEDHTQWVKAVEDARVAFSYISDSNERSGG